MSTVKKPDRIMSKESGERFLECMEALHKAHEVFLKETGGSPGSIFDATRVYMAAAATYFARRSGMEATDEDMRMVLHDMLELGISDYQFNERMHVGSKGAS